MRPSFWFVLAESGLLETLHLHLPGRHDQKRHGRSRSKSAALAVAGGSAAFLVAAGTFVALRRRSSVPTLEKALQGETGRIVRSFQNRLLNVSRDATGYEALDELLGPTWAVSASEEIRRYWRFGPSSAQSLMRGVKSAFFKKSLSLNDEGRMAAAIYAVTQDSLSRQGIKTVRVLRGVSFEEAQGFAAVAAGRRGFSPRPLSSWASDTTIPYEYAWANVAGRGGVRRPAAVIELDVPASQVFMSHMGPRAVLQNSMQEVVLLGTRFDPAWVRSVRVGIPRHLEPQYQKLLVELRRIRKVRVRVFDDDFVWQQMNKLPGETFEWF